MIWCSRFGNTGDRRQPGHTELLEIFLSRTMTVLKRPKILTRVLRLHIYINVCVEGVTNRPPFARQAINNVV